MIIRSKLGEICEFINGGSWTQKEYDNTGIKVVQVTNLVDGTVNTENLKILNNSSYEKYKKHELKENDLVIATVGSHPTQPNSVVGRAVCIPKSVEGYLLNQNAVCIRSISKKLNQKYLVYLGKSELMKNYIAAHARGSANQVRMSISALKEFEYSFPDINKQEKIANILSSYDDLIENNLKRIKLLEETAELIYKEWFVNFRFPGYEKCEFIDGIPSEWKTIKVKEFGDVITGKTPSTKKAEYYGDEIPFIKTPDMSNGIYVVNTNQSLSEVGAKSQENKFIPKDAILVSCIGTLGVVALAKELSQFNQQINAIVCKKKEYIHYLYFKFKSLKEYLEGLGSNGATMGNVNKNKFENIDILKPNGKLLEEYYNFSEPIFKEILNFQLSNQKLKEARDILIPKLINGEIEI